MVWNENHERLHNTTFRTVSILKIKNSFEMQLKLGSGGSYGNYMSEIYIIPNALKTNRPLGSRAKPIGSRRPQYWPRRLEMGTFSAICIEGGKKICPDIINTR